MRLDGMSRVAAPQREEETLPKDDYEPPMTEAERKAEAAYYAQAAARMRSDKNVQGLLAAGGKKMPTREDSLKHLEKKHRTENRTSTFAYNPSSERAPKKMGR